MGRLLAVCACLLFLEKGLLVDGGGVISRLGRRPRYAVLQGGARADDKSPAEEFSEALERLQRGPDHGVGAIRVLVKYLESVRDAPRSPRARRICLSDQEYRDHLAATHGGPEALNAAGFNEVIHDEEGAPFLRMRQVPSPLLVRELLARATEHLDAALSHTKKSAPRTLAGRTTRATRGSAIPQTGANTPPASATEGSGTAENELVKQISSMVTALISELERQSPRKPPEGESPNESQSPEDSEGQSTPPAPVHFRVYRSPGGFPGMPPGGMPGGMFMPGGGMPSAGGDDDDSESEVPLHGTTLHNMAHHGTPWHCMVQHDVAWHSTTLQAWHNLVVIPVHAILSHATPHMCCNSAVCHDTQQGPRSGRRQGY